MATAVECRRCCKWFYQVRVNDDASNTLYIPPDHYDDTLCPACNQEIRRGQSPPWQAQLQVERVSRND